MSDKKKSQKFNVNEVLANVTQIAYPVMEKDHPTLCWKPQRKFSFIKVQKWKKMTVKEWLS